MCADFQACTSVAHGVGGAFREARARRLVLRGVWAGLGRGIGDSLVVFAVACRECGYVCRADVQSAAHRHVWLRVWLFACLFVCLPACLPDCMRARLM